MLVSVEGGVTAWLGVSACVAWLAVEGSGGGRGVASRTRVDTGPLGDIAILVLLPGKWRKAWSVTGTSLHACPHIFRQNLHRQEYR